MSNSLRVPDAGLRLHGPSDSVVPQQAFALSLSDSVISGMIDCVQNGGKIKLSLGASSPVSNEARGSTCHVKEQPGSQYIQTFSYGNKLHKISPPAQINAPYDMYLTQPFESSKTADRIPFVGNLFTKPEGLDSATKAKAKANNVGNSSSGLDSDVEALRDGLAARDAARERSVLVSGLGTSNKASGKAGRKYPGASSGSLSTSPAIKPVQSPILSASEQAMCKAKQLRQVMVHELAVEDRTTSYLQEKWTGSEGDFKPTLEKVAIRDEASKKWTMRKTYFRELDVWKYDYDSQDERQKAIDNAIRRFDNIRISPSEPEWEKLLPKAERGKGKCLSRLQFELSKGPKQNPMIQVQKPDDDSAKDDTDVGREKTKTGGESMSRSSSNPLPKPKKAQPKKLLGSKPKASATPKVSPTKPKAGAGKTNGRVLSKEIIENSDSSGDEGIVTETSKPVPKPVAAPKPAPKAVEKAQPKTLAKKPVAKRPREDDSSSSSGTPLSKRAKQKPLAPVSKARAEPRAEPRAARDNAASPMPRSKNTSPIKSSPLASSPPTNATDLSDSAPAPKKRKADTETRAPAPKRKAVEGDGETRASAPAAKRMPVDDRSELAAKGPAEKRRVEHTNGGPKVANKRKPTTMPTEVVQKAAKFKMIYQKYERRHYEIERMDNPPQFMLDDLNDMRKRLSNMKKDIYTRCAAVVA